MDARHLLKNMTPNQAFRRTGHHEFPSSSAGCPCEERALSSMSRRRVAVAFAVTLLTGIAAHAVEKPERPALSALASHFAAARGMPAGSRPGPPDLNIEVLVGMPAAIIRSNLGVPESCSWVPPPASKHGECWSYTFGPRSARPAGLVSAHGGSDEVARETGGPWLLMLEIRAGRVLAARWLGQR